MPSLADSLVSSSARRLGVRARPDLSIKRHRYQGRSYWVVKEPVSLSYFRFQEEEFAILQMLDGAYQPGRDQGSLRGRVPSTKDHGRRAAAIRRHAASPGAAIADTPGQGSQLKKRRDERWWQEFWGKLSNVLSIRFRGIDPDRLLTWLHQYVNFMYANRPCLPVASWRCRR